MIFIFAYSEMLISGMFIPVLRKINAKIIFRLRFQEFNENDMNVYKESTMKAKVKVFCLLDVSSSALC
jgi:hypothetical protein